MPEEVKKTPWYTKVRNIVAMIAGIVGLLIVLGYNVQASMPPSRTEMQQAIDISITEVQTGIVELRGMLDETKAVIVTVNAAVQVNTDDRMWQRYKFLTYKQETEGLTAEEQRELCYVASYLGMSAPGCQ